MDPADIIDLEKEGTRPRDLVKLFKEIPIYPSKRAVVRTDIDISKKPYNSEKLDPILFNIVTTEGKMTVDRNNMVRFLKANKIVYQGTVPFIFDGYVYRKASDDDVTRMIYLSVDTYDAPPFVTPQIVKDILSKLKSTSTILDIEPPSDWDEDGHYDEDSIIPFDNGIYNFKEDLFLNFSPFVFITHQLKATYDPKVIHHPVEQIYKSIIPDPGTRRFFFEMVGYSIFSQKMAPPAIFVIYGPGNTGKSALQMAVTALAGEDAISTMDLNQLSGTFTTVELLGKLVNICGETGSGQNRAISKVDGELLKRLSDGQTITVQHKHGKPFQMVNRAKLWFITNTLPDFGDRSSGLYRRLYIIPCRQEQSWSGQIYNNLTEWSAVSWLANKALEGYRDFLANGSRFHVSAEMNAELGSYKSQDSLMDFLESQFGTSEKYIIPSKLDGYFESDLYDLYKVFAKDSGGTPLARWKFAEKIRNEFSMISVRAHTYQENGKPTYRKQFAKP